MSDLLLEEAKRNQSHLLSELHAQMDEMETRLDISLPAPIRALKLAEFAPSYISGVLSSLVKTMETYPVESPDYKFLFVFASKMIAAWEETAKEAKHSSTPVEYQNTVIAGLGQMISPSPEEKLVSEFVKLPVQESVRVQLMAVRNILSENDLSKIDDMQDELPLMY